MAGRSFERLANEKAGEVACSDKTIIQIPQFELWQPCRHLRPYFSVTGSSRPQLQLALGPVCLFCQMEEQLNEFFGLTDEETISNKSVNGARCV